MLHPSILATFNAYRIGQQLNAIDACTDAAEYHMIPVYRLARFLVAMDIDADRLSLLA